MSCRAIEGTGFVLATRRMGRNDRFIGVLLLFTSLFALANLASGFP